MNEQTQKTNFKKLLVSCILATDMAKHTKLLEKFSKRTQLTLKVRTDPKLIEQTGNLIENFIFEEKRAEDRRVKLFYLKRKLLE